MAAETAPGLSIVELDIKELENACNHLERSNVELENFLKEGGPDKDLEEAVQENLEALATKKQRIADLRQLLENAAKGLPVPMPTFLHSDPTKENSAVLLTHSQDVVERAAKSGNQVASDMAREATKSLPSATEKTSEPFAVEQDPNDPGILL